MTALGWIFLGVSLASVWSLAGYCYYRVFTEPPADDS
jgi:hypothetical protein